MSDNNGDIKKMMIILSKATLENVYAAFVLANGARMEGIEAEIFFTFFGFYRLNIITIHSQIIALFLRQLMFSIHHSPKLKHGP